MQLLLSVQQIRCTSFDFRSHAVNFVRFEKVYMLGAQIFVVYGTITNEKHSKKVVCGPANFSRTYRTFPEGDAENGAALAQRRHTAFLSQ